MFVSLNLEPGTFNLVGPRCRMPPFRFFVQRRLGKIAQRANRFAVGHNRSRRKNRSGRLIHKWHELIRESRHRAADANSPHVGTAAHSSDPASLSDITLNHGSPAPQFNDALGGAVLFRELGLLIVSAAIATFVNGLAKKPSGPQGFIERNHGCTTSGLVQEIKQSL